MANGVLFQYLKSGYENNNFIVGQFHIDEFHNTKSDGALTYSLPNSSIIFTIFLVMIRSERRRLSRMDYDLLTRSFGDQGAAAVHPPTTITDRKPLSAPIKNLNPPISRIRDSPKTSVRLIVI